MKRFLNCIFISFFILFSFIACNKTDSDLDLSVSPIKNPPVSTTPPPDTSFRPIVMIHGLLASGDTYTSFAQRFSSNGYKWSRLFVFDWNTLAQGANDISNLDKFIDQVRTTSGYSQVELIGHSAGGGLAYNYLKDASRATKVAHYVHLASGSQSSAAGPTGNVPTLNIWSDGDKVGQSGNISGAKNVKMNGLDHYQVATSAASFEEVFQFFKNEKPQTTGIAWESNPCIGGRVVTFGENQPAADAIVSVYEVNSITGERVSDKPMYQTKTDVNGQWKPVIVRPGIYYELEVKEVGPGKRALHYYREGFTHNNLLVYLRTIPPPTSLAGFLLSGLPNNPEQSVLNVFSSSQAVVSGRDSLTVDNSLMSTASIAPASKTMIALFLYDNNKNNKSDFTPITLYSSLSFLNGIDQFFDTQKTDPIVVQMNNRRLALRRWKASDDIIIAVFD